MENVVTISDVIQKLTEIQSTKGNLEVYIFDVENGNVPLILNEIEVVSISDKEVVSI